MLTFWGIVVLRSLIAATSQHEESVYYVAIACIILFKVLFSEVVKRIKLWSPVIRRVWPIVTFSFLFEGVFALALRLIVNSSCKPRSVFVASCASNFIEATMAIVSWHRLHKKILTNRLEHHDARTALLDEQFSTKAQSTISAMQVLKGRQVCKWNCLGIKSGTEN